MTESISEEIRRRRVAAGLSQGALAKRAGIYRDSISNLELGKTPNARGTTIHRLRKALDEVEADHEPTPVTPVTPSAPGMISVSVVGLYGDKTLTVEASPENVDELGRLIDRIMANLRGVDASGGGADG